MSLSRSAPAPCVLFLGITLALSGALACSRSEKPAGSQASATTQGSVAKPDQTAKTVESAGTREPVTRPVNRDMSAIQKTKVLNVLFTFNSTSYFVYRGETMGYEYELLSRFAAENGLTLKPIVVRDSKTLFDSLNRGAGDIVAAQLVRPDNDVDVLYGQELYHTSPALVQRKGENPAQNRPPEVSAALEREQRETPGRPLKVRARLISRPSELGGERLHMPKSSPYRRRLIELNNELETDIDVIEVDESTDKLIQELSEGAIGFTVAAENFAALKTADYTNLLITPLLGPPERVVWAVRRNAPELLGTLDAWLDKNRKSGLMNILYKKYFLDRRGFRQRAISDFLTSETGRLSRWDEVFREYAKIPGWDWRLLAAQAYQESRFEPASTSWAGARGLMQIMPRTARELRVNPNDPKQSVMGASRYLWQLDQYWAKQISRPEERLKFVLASYNTGTGHVEDARRLARKFNDDPNDWDDVAYWLIRKSKRAVYNDPVVRHGFARGVESVTYVSRILDRYDNYKEFVAAPRAVGFLDQLWEVLFPSPGGRGVRGEGLAPAVGS